MGKNSFILQARLSTVVAKLSDKQAGVLFKGILNYAANGAVATFEDNAVSIVFEMVRQDIDYNAERYAQTCAKRAESGRLGGKQKVANLANASKCKQKLANCSKAKHNDVDVDNDNDSNTMLTHSDTNSISDDMLIITPQKDPQAGTFRAEAKTKLQKLGVWWVKTYYPELYASAGVKATTAWFKRYGKALSEVLNLADGSVPLAVAGVLATQEQMNEFQKRKGEDVLWGLEAVSRNFTENYNRAQEILQSGNLPQEVLKYA